jgi:hypothetical protein
LGLRETKDVGERGCDSQLVRSSVGEEEKVALWFNTINHSMGDHRHCLGAHNAVPKVWEKLHDKHFRARFNGFLKKTE